MLAGPRPPLLLTWHAGTIRPLCCGFQQCLNTHWPSQQGHMLYWLASHDTAHNDTATEPDAELQELLYGRSRSNDGMDCTHLYI